MNIKCDSQDFVELEKSCWCNDFFNAQDDDAFQFLSCNEMLIEDKNVLIVSDYSEVDFFTKAPLKKEVVTKIKELTTPFVERLVSAEKFGRFDLNCRDGCVNVYKPKINRTFYVIFVYFHLANSDLDDDLINDICHDLREPLRSISNFLQLLKINAAKRNDTTDMNFINYALTSAAKLRQWTDEVLPNGARPQEDLVDITEIVKEVKVLMSFQLGAYGISVNIDKCIPIIFGNKTQIFRLFKNLMENAVKHAKTKDLAIDIYLESIDLGKNIANIIFQDNGARLAKKEVSKLSDIVNFGRISSTKGLSICKKFAARNSGNVTYVPSDIGCKYCISLNCDPHRKNGRINYE